MTHQCVRHRWQSHSPCLLARRSSLQYQTCRRLSLPADRVPADRVDWLNLTRQCRSHLVVSVEVVTGVAVR